MYHIDLSMFTIKQLMNQGHEVFQVCKECSFLKLLLNNIIRLSCLSVGLPVPGLEWHWWRSSLPGLGPRSSWTPAPTTSCRPPTSATTWASPRRRTRPSSCPRRAGRRAQPASRGESDRTWAGAGPTARRGTARRPPGSWLAQVGPAMCHYCGTANYFYFI